MLRLPDHYVWDFWLAPRLSADDLYHLYTLFAPRDIPDPEQRHNLARIGHATSPDLHNWTWHGQALDIGQPGEWDDLTHWTGSVIHHDNRLVLFYTGRNRDEGGRVQRIGLATSDDRLHFAKHPANPMVVVDSRWYQTAANGAANEDCRDPWVSNHNGEWLMHFTASARDQPWDRFGVIGLATSSDLINWQVQAPVTDPGRFHQVEVPQLLRAGDHWQLLFCTNAHPVENGVPIASWTGTHYFVGASPAGPFTLAPEPPMCADDAGTLYAGRIVDDPWDGMQFLAFRHWDEDGSFAGDIIDPLTVVVEGGKLKVEGCMTDPE